MVNFAVLNIAALGFVGLLITENPLSEVFRAAIALYLM